MKIQDIVVGMRVRVRAGRIRDREGYYDSDAQMRLHSGESGTVVQTVPSDRAVLVCADLDGLEFWFQARNLEPILPEESAPGGEGPDPGTPQGDPHDPS